MSTSASIDYDKLTSMQLITGERERGIMTEGLSLLLLNTLNDDYNAMNEQIGVPLSHPIHISELFTPHSQKPTKMDMNYTVTGLSKLLLFNAYAQTQSENVNSYISGEAMKYPYPRKASLPEVRCGKFHGTEYFE